jgi:hypothetical protein
VVVDLNGAATSHGLDAALKLLRDESAALARLNLNDKIQGFFGLKDISREVLAR